MAHGDLQGGLPREPRPGINGVALEEGAPDGIVLHTVGIQAAEAVLVMTRLSRSRRFQSRPRFWGSERLASW